MPASSLLLTSAASSPAGHGKSTSCLTTPGHVVDPKAEDSRVSASCPTTPERVVVLKAEDSRVSASCPTTPARPGGRKAGGHGRFPPYPATPVALGAEDSSDTSTGSPTTLENVVAPESKSDNSSTAGPTTPERFVGPQAAIPIGDRDFLPLRLQPAGAPGLSEAFERQTRHLVWQVDEDGGEFVWKPECKPTVDTAHRLLAFYLGHSGLGDAAHTLGLLRPSGLAAAPKAARVSVLSIMPFAEGAHNILFEVAFRVSHGCCRWDGVQANGLCISALLRISQPEAPFHRLESEVATSTYARAHAGIPAPRTFSFDSSGQNPFGLEWALLEKMPGQRLDDLFTAEMAHIPRTKKDDIVDDIVFGFLPRHWDALFDRAFAELGSLYIDWEACAYTIGPVVSQLFSCNRRLLCTEVHRGPYRRAGDYVGAHLQLFDWELRQRQQDGEAVPERRRAHGQMAAIAGWAAAVFAPTRAAPGMRTFLSHQDLHAGNVLMGPGPGHRLAALLDWEDIVCAPLAFHAPPKVAAADHGLGCRREREATFRQLPRWGQVPLEVLYAGAGGFAAEAPPLSLAQYYHRCTERLRARAAADFSAFAWAAPEYALPPPRAAAAAASFDASEAVWAALLQNLLLLERTGEQHLGAATELGGWLDQAWAFCRDHPSRAAGAKGDGEAARVAEVDADPHGLDVFLPFPASVRRDGVEGG